MAYDREQVWKSRFNGNPKVAFDDCGAEIHRDAPENSLYSWEVDHIFPDEILKLLDVPEELRDAPENLRPLHHSNNEAKGMHYPIYEAKIVGDGKSHRLKINDSRQKTLDGLYGLYINLRKLELELKQLHDELLSCDDITLINFFHEMDQCE